MMNEKAFEKLLCSMSCNGCIYFMHSKCTHEMAEENEKDKPIMVKHALEKGGPFSIEWAKNIDNHFLCENYEERI